MNDYEQCTCMHTYNQHRRGLVMPCLVPGCGCPDFTDTGELGEFDEEYDR